MKKLSVTSTAIGISLLLCGFSTSGRQQENESASGESCKMGGPWEAGCFERIVRTIPTLKGKAEYLTLVVDSLKGELRDLKFEAAMLRTRINSDEQGLVPDIQRISALEAQVDKMSYLVGLNYLNNQPQGRDDMRNELDHFKAAVCPVVQTARMDSDTRRRLDSACASR